MESNNTMILLLIKILIPIIGLGVAIWCVCCIGASKRDKEDEEEGMKLKFQKLLCFILGHRFHTMTQIWNGRSQFGHVKCTRCGYCEDYQYDT